MSNGQQTERSRRNEKMIRWNNDYNHGTHPAILETLAAVNNSAYAGYGMDEWCEEARQEIRKYINRDDAEIHFLVGGTQANYTVISAGLRPFQGVISADTGHINCHETGAVENTGHKIHVLPGKDGKLSAWSIKEEAESYRMSGVQEHITQPKMVYLSFPSEYGTIYTKAELEEIRSVCDEYGLILFIDGARMGYGLGAESCDVTLADIALLADAFTIGGTKCGAMFGEVVVLSHPLLKDHFRSFIKQNGGMLAKGWLLGLQFAVLFRDGLYFDITRRADEQAQRIRKAFADRGIAAYFDSDTNQQFVILNETQMEQISENHIYEYERKLDDSHHAVRFCTSWSTVDTDVDILIADIANLPD